MGSVTQDSNLRCFNLACRVFDTNEGAVALEPLGRMDIAGNLSLTASSVGLFMLVAGQRIPMNPEIPSEEVLNLRLRLLVEEVCEFAWACGYLLGEADPDKEPVGKLAEEYGIELRRIDHQKPDYEGMVDACADIAFVNIGNMLTLGAGDIDLMNNVCDANLRKFEGDWSIKDGKLVKPSNWTPPVYECVTKFNAGE